MKTPTVSFIKSLRSYNKDLRVRWSYERRKWVIEHKAMDKRSLFTPVRMEMTQDGRIIEHIMPRLSDRFIQYHDSYYGVVYTKSLDNRVIPAIAAMDTAHFKSGKAYAKSVEEGEAQVEAFEDRKKSEDLAGHSNDVYNYLKNRGTQAFPGGTAK